MLTPRGHEWLPRVAYPQGDWLPGVYPDPDPHQLEKWDPSAHQTVLDPPHCSKDNKNGGWKSRLTVLLTGRCPKKSFKQWLDHFEKIVESCRKYYSKRWSQICVRSQGVCILHPIISWPHKGLKNNIIGLKSCFKEAVSRDYWPLFLSWIKPILALDKQAKMVLLKNSFSWRYSNSKFDKFDFSQYITAWSRKFLTS